MSHPCPAAERRRSEWGVTRKRTREGRWATKRLEARPDEVRRLYEAPSLKGLRDSHASGVVFVELVGERRGASRTKGLT